MRIKILSNEFVSRVLQVTSRTLLGNFCIWQLKLTLQNRFACFFKQRILEYLWLVFDISFDTKLSYFDGIVGNIF